MSTLSNPPFSTDDASVIASGKFGIEGEISQLDGERDLNFLVRSLDGDYVLKFAHPDNELKILELQNQAISLCHAVSSFNSPEVVRSRDRQSIVRVSDLRQRKWHARCLTFVPGTPLVTIGANDPRRNARLWQSIGTTVAELDSTLGALNHNKTAHREFWWDLSGAPAMIRSSEFVSEDTRRAEILSKCLANYERIHVRLSGLPSSVIHNDLNDYNLLLADQASENEPQSELPRIGVIDFGDMVYSKTINNLAICLAYCTLDMPDPVRVAAEVTAGYHARRELSETELSVLFPLLCLRLAHSVCVSNELTRASPDNPYLAVSQEPAWKMLEQLLAIHPDEAREQIASGCRAPQTRSATSADGPSKLLAENEQATLAERRKQTLSPSLSLSYQRPLHIVRGRGQYLYDTNDVTYLDCVNNVCHVGHCHPAVVAAASAQNAVLNTNTRYLHKSIVQLAERLTATMPDPLQVCFFVNSGSEANDLALRLARNYTEMHDIAVIDSAYHGHLTSLIEISPYKFNSRGGRGKPDHVHVLPLPENNRNELTSSAEGQADELLVRAREVLRLAQQQNRKIAALIAEPVVGCGGQVPLPAAYLQSLYATIKGQGGVCISDEVQVGFGRLGTDYWGFSGLGVVPDIVTMGKPFGNGHPLAAVVTTRAIATAFNNGMEYFNTFGGNPVSCAIGLAVMNVIEKEGLQEHALKTGAWLLDQIRELQQKHVLIGDVRGSGFFLGIELVTDRETRAPATEIASRVINSLRDKCILLSTDGPYANVLKFKPPMVFSMADAERVVMTLDKVLANQ